MARNISLDNIQSRVAAVADLNEDTSDISTAEYSLRREYINMAQAEWAESYDWQSLYRENNSLVSTANANASVVLPDDFRKLASPPFITYDGSTTEAFPAIRPQEKGQYDSVSSKYVMVLGDQSTGHVMYVNAGTLASGASITVPYYRSPSSLVSPADIAMCPNPDYLVQRTLAWLWEGKRDNRFPQAKAEADKILARMLEFEQTQGEAYDNEVKTVERTEYGNFRWGKS